MAVTVQAQMLALALRVDPRTKAGVEFALGTIGTTAGNRFTAQRLLDIYNEARMAMASAIRISMPPEKRAAVVPGNIVRITNLTFASGVAAVPAGCIDPIAMQDSTGSDISIVGANLIPLLSRNESATVRFVAWEGTNFKAPPGSAFIPDAATYRLWYYGVSNFTLANVTGGVVTETYNDDLLPRLLNIAARIANVQGNYDAQQIVLDELKRG
jgi:hypothetical protein